MDVVDGSEWTIKEQNLSILKYDLNMWSLTKTQSQITIVQIKVECKKI